MKVRVLVTQASMKHTLSIVRSLGSRGAEVHVISESRRALAALSRFCKQVHMITAQDEQQYVKHLLQILRSFPFDVLIPVGYPVTEYIARHHEALLPFVRLVSESIEKIEFVSNKIEIIRFAEDIGVPVPTTKEASTLSGLQTMGDFIGYPLVIKGKRESGKGIVDFVWRPADLVSTFERLLARFDLSSFNDLILQEYIPGWGCGFFALYDHGKAQRVFMHRRVREYPVSGGSSCCAESFYDPTLKEYGMKLLGALNWHGLAMLEFRFDIRDRTYKLIEVNPKFWGSLDLALAVGADFPGDLVRMALGESLTYNEKYPHVRFQWPFHGDFKHALDAPSARKAVFSDFLNPKVRKNFRLNDPLPDIVSLVAFIKALAIDMKNS